MNCPILKHLMKVMQRLSREIKEAFGFDREPRNFYLEL